MTEKVTDVVEDCPLPVGTFNSYRCAEVNPFRYDIPREKFHTTIGIHFSSRMGWRDVCSLPVDLLKCTRSVPFANGWVQHIVDIAVANGPVCNMS